MAMASIRALYPKDGITLHDVGLRAGLQLVKVEWIKRERAAGVRHCELVTEIEKLDGTFSSALTLNARA